MSIERALSRCARRHVDDGVSLLAGAAAAGAAAGALDPDPDPDPPSPEDVLAGVLVVAPPLLVPPSPLLVLAALFDVDE
jgi:hypothetical protein